MLIHPEGVRCTFCGSKVVTHRFEGWLVCADCCILVTGNNRSSLAIRMLQLPNNQDLAKRLGLAKAIECIEDDISHFWDDPEIQQTPSK